MPYLFELSKEHSTIPSSEVFACLEAEGIKYKKIELNEDVIVIHSKKKNTPKISERLAFTFYIDKLLFSSQINFKKIKDKANENKLKENGSIAIRYRNRSEKVDSQKIVETLADVYSKNKKVDLSNPNVEIRALITDKKVYVGLKKSEIDRKQFRNRKVQHRPFFSPISLHPKFARALVNLSKVKKGETLLDPFCGTGGILLEAGLIDAYPIGADIEKKMIDGCKKTLKYYDVKDFRLFQSDVGNIGNHIKKMDAVVTDLPYGKATTTKGESLTSLYNRAFKNINKVLKKGKTAVIGVSNKDALKIGESYLSLEEIHPLRVHNSLTRFFAVYKK